MMDIIERLRGTPSIITALEAAAEIEHLRNLLQNGSPVVEGTIQHMAMEIAEWKNKALAFEESMLMFERDAEALKRERDELRDALYALAKLGADKGEK